VEIIVVKINKLRLYLHEANIHLRTPIIYASGIVGQTFEANFIINNFGKSEINVDSSFVKGTVHNVFGFNVHVDDAKMMHQ
jgi:hypothetical protein